MLQGPYLCNCIYCAGQKWVSAATWCDHNRLLFHDPPKQQPSTTSTVCPTDIHARDKRTGIDGIGLSSARRVKEEVVDMATIPPFPSTHRPQPRFDSSMRVVQPRSECTANMIPPPLTHITQPRTRHNPNVASMRTTQPEFVMNTIPPFPSSTHIPQPPHIRNDMPSMLPVQPQPSAAAGDFGSFLRTASEQLLMAVGNRAYMELSQENWHLKTDLIATRSQCDDLMNDLKHTQQLNTIVPQPSSTSQTAINPNPNREGYPNVKYWYRWEWKKRANLQQQQYEEITDENACTTLRFITHPDGRSINAFEAYEIRKSCRHIWNTLAAYSQAPDVWSNATDVAVRYFNEQMYLKHPIMRLCADNWKLDQLAKLDYHGWMRNRRNSKRRIQVLKPEPQDENGATSNTVFNMPRLQDDVLDHSGYMLSKPQSLTSISLSLGRVSTASTIASSPPYASKMSRSP